MFFFFQAEDGIRDVAVTGVQTCALPISLCRHTLDVFVDGLGAAAGDLALSVLASAGVYVGGGIAPRIVAHLRKGAFLRAFRDKGRMSGYLARVPLHVIVNPHVALLGAAAVAARLP